MSFEGKVGIITGAASGIGRACAISFARKGGKVVAVDVNEDKLKGLVIEIQHIGGEVIGIKADVSKKCDVDLVIEETVKKYGKIDVLINCAGICQVKSIEDLTEEDWDKVININLKGTFFMCQAVLKEMKKLQSGKIVNIGSLAGEVGGIVTAANYAASKAGVICLTKSLAKYAAPYNINVNCVSPGFIDTEMTKGFPYDPKNVPLGRIGTPEEVADVILFLCSDAARYITGANVDVNGGIYMG